MTTTINPVIATAVMAAAASLGLAAVIFLIALLVQRELLSGAEAPGPRRAAESLFVVIVPLLVVFAFIVVSRTIDVWH